MVSIVVVMHFVYISLSLAFTRPIGNTNNTTIQLAIQFRVSFVLFRCGRVGCEKPTDVELR